MIRPRTPRGVQLGEFLATKRKGVDRAGLGLLGGTRRSSSGLSREEVAILAGMSVSWYTWLEQGRDINASRQVLAAVARVLQLTSSEAEYVFALAGPNADFSVVEHKMAPAHLQRLIDSLDYPAFIVSSAWDILGWNQGYEWLYGPIATLPTAERNLLGLVYTDPRLREMLPDWESDSRAFMAEFRAESGARLSSEGHREVVERLLAQSEDFRRQWAEQSVERFKSRLRTFVHPDAGVRVFEHHRLVPSDATDLHVVMYVPVVEPVAESASEPTAS